MNKYIKIISEYLIVALVITNVMMLISMQKLPNRIKDAVNYNNYHPDSTKKDTIKNIITPSLETKDDMVYFEGYVIEDGFKISEKFEYDPDLPVEIFKGYITLVESNRGGRYYIWSKNKILKSNLSELKGWFIPGNDKYEYESKKFYQIIFPIVKKEKV